MFIFASLLIDYLSQVLYAPHRVEKPQKGSGTPMLNQKSVLVWSLAFTLTALMSCGEGLDPNASKKKFSQMEGSPANLTNIAGEWQSDCLTNEADGSGIGSTIKNFRFEGTTFFERTTQFVDAHCTQSRAAIKETANGTFSLITTGSKIKFAYNYRAITLMNDNQVSIYNSNETCGISNWRNSVGRDVSRADCTAALNSMVPATIGVLEEDGIYTDIKLKTCMMTPRGVQLCDELELGRLDDGLMPTLESVDE
jgi:hypothetical protein